VKIASNPLETISGGGEVKGFLANSSLVRFLSSIISAGR